MLAKECSGCKYVIWMVGIGQGIRCEHPHNEQYNGLEPNTIPKSTMYHHPIISDIPSGCKLKEDRNI